MLATGWNAAPEAVIARVHPSLRPTAIAEGETDAAAAALAYYAGDVTAIDGVTVRQHGTEMQRIGWAALRRIEPGRPMG